ncbi:MAG: dihydrolipoamide dehydrogenase [miscellaneous Crenarchaeota group-6 archaeon AD8-1]|nr:MAG: dihydrolipoamide dehydrogenase [miscellaneous Crenarchaeota group-6 archaeon AD8-1]
MKNYDLIVIGTGSGTSVAEAAISESPDLKIAIIDKDEPGGICLTRGCIPSKLLIYPADIIRLIQKSKEFGIKVELKKIDFTKIMHNMRLIINRDIENIRQGLTNSKNIDYYPNQAEFIEPYIIKVGNQKITSKLILLCTGSRPLIPPIKSLDEVGFLTSDTLLNLKKLPKSVAIIGGGYIAAEFGHFLSAMGSKVTIIGRNIQFLPKEEPEISAIARKELEKHLTILSNFEVIETQKTSKGKMLIAKNRENLERKKIIAEEILIATGRRSNSDILRPELGGIKTDKRGFIAVDDYLETSQSGVYALGDANGKFLFKHAANYEAKVVYFNAIEKKKMKVDYHAIPHAVFSEPEIGSVGMKENEAVKEFGRDNVLIGFYRYEDTAKGEAMKIRDFFVKAILQRETGKILGAHIVGPQASVLIQEIINLMYTENQSAEPLIEAMHIHPALSEVVERAFRSLRTIDQYHHLLKDHLNLPIS